MLVAVISDIHCNVFALRAVLGDVERAGADEVWINGDTFGYYPWASDAFATLDLGRGIALLGNHDGWILAPKSAPADIAGDIARHNAAELASARPAAATWLETLSPVRRLERYGWRLTLAHGTPDDPLDGRYYPDNRSVYEWLPGPGEIVILGQTHYPILRGDGDRGLLLNPGSVGQPRDSDPMPSWALLDLATGRAELRRSVYDNLATMARLRELRWNEGLILALDRRARPA